MAISCASATFGLYANHFKLAFHLALMSDLGTARAIDTGIEHA
jgi:hypothetical protein